MAAESTDTKNQSMQSIFGANAVLGEGVSSISVSANKNLQFSFATLCNQFQARFISPILYHFFFHFNFLFINSADVFVATNDDE